MKYLDNTGLAYFKDKLDTELATKQDSLVSGTNIKTINNESLLGSGNITIQSGGSPTWGSITGTLSNQTDLQSVLDSKMPITDITDSTVRVYELDTGLYRIMGTSTNPITVYWKSGGYSFEVNSTEYLLLTINENETVYHFLATKGIYFYEGYVNGPTSGFNKVLSDRDIKDVLTSTDTKSVLSANQGKILNESKQDTLVSGTNIKTINNQSILGSGNLDILNMVYPVGSIYMSVNSTSPATLFGGRWEAISQGRTLVGVGTGTDINGNTMTWTAEAEGGEYLHTLTHDELPIIRYFKGDVNSYDWGNTLNASTQAGNNYGLQYPYVGHGYAHNNIQPFFAVYMWKRTA